MTPAPIPPADDGQDGRRPIAGKARAVKWRDFPARLRSLRSPSTEEREP